MKRLYARQDAADYLGMSATSFDAMASPALPYILVGKTGKRYDRHDLDAWVDVQRKIQPEATKKCQQRDSKNVATSGTLIKSSMSAGNVSQFVNLLAAARKKTQKQS